jgi:hypothetical protein
MICPNCHVTVSLGASDCAKCGAVISSAPATPTTPPPDAHFSRGNRLVAVGIFWVFFGVISTFAYANFVHDVGATYWALWTLVLPFALPFIWLFDFVVTKAKGLVAYPGRILALDSAFALSLWYIPGYSIGVLLIVAVGAMALTQD